MRLLFQGDSITDAGRNREDLHDLGHGYPLYAAKFIKEAFPEADIEFIDKGISGDQTKDLVARLEEDFISLQPDMVSIMIGVNDTWHEIARENGVDTEKFERARFSVLGNEDLRGGIGTLGERALHKILKLYFEPDQSCHEIEILGSVADISIPSVLRKYKRAL